MRKKTTTKKKSANAKTVNKKTVNRKRTVRRSRAKKHKWIVTTSSDRPIGDVAKDLAKAGLTRPKVLKEVGSITGSAGEDAIPRLRRIRGVAAVEAETPIDIGPPGSPTTW